MRGEQRYTYLSPLTLCLLLIIASNAIAKAKAKRNVYAGFVSSFVTPNHPRDAASHRIGARRIWHTPIVCSESLVDTIETKGSDHSRDDFSEEKSSATEQNATGIFHRVNDSDDPHAQLGPTFLRPQKEPLSSLLRSSLLSNEHPSESREELGLGRYLFSDWRHAWYSYSSSCGETDEDRQGYTQYEIMPNDMDGKLPEDLIGDLYRNGPGKMGVNGERVQHVLDGDGLITRMQFRNASNQRQRSVTFQSRFVETEAFLKEEKAQQFVYRGTFGTAPRGLKNLFGDAPRDGVNAEPPQTPLLSRVAANAFHTAIKNTANTHVVSFGGKLLALFEAGLPYRIDPETLQTLGTDEMEGTLKASKLPVKLRDDLTSVIPEAAIPSFLGGAAHTAHPKICPTTNHLVGWHWSQIVPDDSLEVTLSEWNSHEFDVVARKSHTIPNCVLAPHDMALTEDCVILLLNALKMNRLPFVLGIKGPAESLAMDGSANVRAVVLPRPCSPNQFEPYYVEVPPNFSIHFSHAYQDPLTNNLVAYFSGWPPSDAKDFLGAWGGFCPLFSVIPPTFLWRLELDTAKKACLSLSVASGASNVCLEHCVVHPNFATKKARNVCAVASNIVGDSSPPSGYVRVRIEDGTEAMLEPGQPNRDVDAYWFGTRVFAEEPVVVPKHGGDLNDEDDAYLLGMIFDGVKRKSALAIFDLKRELVEGPVCVIWLRTQIPHGLHGCFAPNGGGSTSTFC